MVPKKQEVVLYTTEENKKLNFANKIFQQKFSNKIQHLPISYEQLHVLLNADSLIFPEIPSVHPQHIIWPILIHQLTPLGSWSSTYSVFLK